MKTPDLTVAEPVSVMNFLISMFFILGLIFLATYILKKVMGKRISLMKRSNVSINVIANTPLGDKKLLSVVEIQDKYFFLGISQNSINMLSELDINIPENPGPELEKNEFENILSRAKMMFHRIRK